jgi:hypothetical protein
MTINYFEANIACNCEICGKLIDEDNGPHELKDMVVCTGCFSQAVDDDYERVREAGWE